MSGSLMLTGATHEADAAVGSLPEFADTNAVLQGVTIRVADQSQEKAMIAFLEGAFDCKVLRKRIRGSVEETWLGYGPEEFRIPKEFVIPVSSFGEYGGHASIHLVYDSKTSTPYYRTGDASLPGDNIAFLQLAVPGYRISQMVKNGGNILDAYGYVNVISPAGLPIRGIVGIWPDPIMFVSINCVDVEQSKAFYEQLGFVEQEYPYSRPSKGAGQFEPPQQPKSVYMAPSPNCMGVLLLPSKKKKISANPVVQSLNIVYTPSSAASSSADTVAQVVDPSGVGVTFQPYSDFEKEEQITR
jgi:hypothetical protein